MTRIAIHVDDRERASAVFELLGTAPDFEVTVTRLKLGDYLLDGRFLFERKTAADLAASIISARLFSQALRLATSPVRPALIVEGAEHELAQTGMSWESLQGALISVAFFCGIPVLRTRSPEETVRTMLFTAQQGHARALGALPRAGYRPRGKRARQLYILQGLPGIGPERARRLLAHFSSVEAVMKANASALCAVPGIGKDIAEKLRWSVEEPHLEYRVTPERMPNRNQLPSFRSWRFGGGALNCLARGSRAWIWNRPLFWLPRIGSARTTRSTSRSRGGFEPSASPRTSACSERFQRSPARCRTLAQSEPLGVRKSMLIRFWYSPARNLGMKTFIIFAITVLFAAVTAGHAAEQTKKQEEPKVQAQPGPVPRHQGLIGGGPPRAEEKPFGYPGVPQRRVRKPAPLQPPAGEPLKSTQPAGTIKG